MTIGHPTNLEIVRYLDGELPWWRRRSVQRHVEACWQCRARADEIRQITGDFIRYREKALFPGVPPPPAQWRDLRAALRDAPAFAVRPRRAGWVPALAALAAAALGAAVYYGGRRMETQPRSLPSVKPAAPSSAPPRTSALPRVGATAPVAPPALAVPRPRDQVRIRAALHGVSADLGEPVELRSRNGRWEVAVLGLAPHRLAEIRAALPPGVPVVVEEAPPTLALPGGASAPRQSASDPLPGALVGRLGGQANFERLANRILEESDDMMARAFALRNLDRQLPAALDTESLTIVARIRASHKRAFSMHAARLAELTAPLREATAAPALPAAPQAVDLATAGQRLDRILNAFLAGAPHPRPRSEWPAELAQALGAVQ